MDQMQLHPASGLPAYRQVIDQVKRLVASGRLAPGERLASVRTLARQLGINPMTVEKAYRVLTAQGAIEARARRGLFVAKSVGRLTPRTRRQAMAAILDQVVTEAVQLGVSAGETAELLRQRFAGRGAVPPRSRSANRASRIIQPPPAPRAPSNFTPPAAQPGDDEDVSLL